MKLIVSKVDKVSDTVTEPAESQLTPGHARDSRQDAADWCLIARIGQGDRVAFEQLYRRFFDYLYRFIFQQLRHSDLVEEVINDVMLVVWQKAAEVTPQARASTWIMSIAYNKALTASARRANSRVDAKEIEALEAYGNEEIAAVDTQNLFECVLKKLPPEQRAVLELLYYQELAFSEIAEIMGVPENTVKTRVFHARQKLRALWPEYAGRAQENDRNSLLAKQENVKPH